MKSVKYLKNILYVINSIITVIFKSSFKTKALNLLKQKYIGSECYILGNGPSLKDNLDDLVRLGGSKKKGVFVVNNFVASPYYEKIKPSFYVFADPGFFNPNAIQRIRELRKSIIDQLIAKTSWDLTIFVPFLGKGNCFIQEIIENNNKIKFYYFNTTSLNKGPKGFLHFLYKINVASPLQQTVVSSALYLALNIGFKKIYLLGADHSWHENIVIDKNNQLFMKDPHFYDVGQHNLVPVTDADGKFFKIHEFLIHSALALESHIDLNSYALTLNAKIYNASTKSFVDAYEKISLKAQLHEENNTQNLSL